MCSTFNQVKSTRGYSGGKRRGGIYTTHSNNTFNEQFNPSEWLNNIIYNNPSEENIVHIIRTAICRLNYMDLKSVF